MLPLYNYAKISLNGEYWGVYLALEAVEDSFLLRNYGTRDGELYKPESMGIGGGNNDDKSSSSKSREGFGKKSEDTDTDSNDEKNSDKNKDDNSGGGGFKPGNMPGGGDFDPSNMPNMSNFDASWKNGSEANAQTDNKDVTESESGSEQLKNLVIYGGCLGLMLVAMIPVLLFKRRR